DLFHAALEGNLGGAIRALAASANIDMKHNVGWASIHAAAQNGHLSIVRILLNRGANINARDFQGYTALIWATERGHCQITELLLQSGADTSCANNLGYKAIHMAALRNNAIIIKQLAKYKVNLDAQDSGCGTALHLTCQFGNYEAAVALLDEGCQVQPMDEFSNTPLHKAALAGRLQMGKLLEEWGHDLTVKDERDINPLDTAHANGHIEIVAWLAKHEAYHGIPINYKPSQVTARVQFEEDGLNYMIYIRQDPQRALLNLSQGRSDVHHRDSQGRVLLHWAAETGDINVIKDLISHGAHPGAVCLKGHTPADVALEHGHKHIHHYLSNAAQPHKHQDWISECRRYFLVLWQISQGGFMRDPDDDDTPDLTVQENDFARIRRIIKLLLEGTPQTPPGSITSHLVNTAINNNSPRALQLLFSLDAPLYGTDRGFGILQQIWLCTTSTTREAVIVTRQVEMKLESEYPLIGYEENADQALKDGVRSLIMSLGSDRQLKHILEKIIPGYQLLPFMGTTQTGYTALERLQKYLKDPKQLSVIKTLHNEMGNIKPWRIKWKLTKYDFDKRVFTRACRWGASMSSWWVWHAKVNATLPDCQGEVPLLVAAMNNHWSTVRHLITFMGANPYLNSPSGVIPMDIFPTETRETITRELAMREFNILDTSLDSARSEAERSETKSIALLIPCFYLTCKLSSNKNCNWRTIYSHLLGLMDGRITVDKDLQICQFIDDKTPNPNVNLKNGDEKVMKETEKEENANVTGKDSKKEKSYEYEEDTEDIYSWILKLCQKISFEFHKHKTFDTNNERVSLPELIFCITELKKSIKLQSENTYKLCQKTKTVILPILSLKHILKKAMKVATEGRFYFLLHMLTTNALQSMDDHLNDMLESLPLHHAAASGKITNVAYLLLTCKAKPDAQDINGNTAAHISYMNGHKTVAKYLLTNHPSLKVIKNTSGKTPKMIKEAQSDYEKLYDMKVDDPESEEYFEITEQTDPEKLITKLMECWLLRTKGTSFKSLVEKRLIDYSKGEAKTLLTLTTEFAQKIGDGITKINSIFKGRLVLVGSAGDQARLYAPDEFDCSWILDWDNISSKLVELPKEQQMYRQYKHEIFADSETPEIKKLLQKTNILEEFYACAQEAIKEIIPSIDSRLTLVLPGIKRIGCGVCLSMAWYGNEYPLLLIKIDLVPAIKTPRPNNFPLPPLTEKLNLAPHLKAVYIVQTHIREGEFRIATTLLEQHFMQEATLRPQRFTFLIAKLMISLLKTEKWAPRLYKDRFSYFDSRHFKLPTPSGFLLKSAYFHELENVPNSEAWKANCIVDRLKGIFYAMCRPTKDNNSLDSGKIQNYFSPTTQPAEAGFMAPAIFKFIQNNENELILKQTFS
ncbi:unnamed protein product, partial [Meganyctiphanes norvegica]